MNKSVAQASAISNLIMNHYPGVEVTVNTRTVPRTDSIPSGSEDGNNDTLEIDERCEVNPVGEKPSRSRQKITTENYEERQARLKVQREKAKERIRNESPEAREKRLEKLKLCQRRRLQNESPEQRASRLAKMRECSARRHDRIKNESLAEKSHRLERQKAIKKAKKLKLKDIASPAPSEEPEQNVASTEPSSGVVAHVSTPQPQPQQQQIPIQQRPQQSQLVNSIQHLSGHQQQMVWPYVSAAFPNASNPYFLAQRNCYLTQ